MKLKIVDTKPPRWFLFDDHDHELAQRADAAFYEAAVQDTRKGKSVHDTLLGMEAKPAFIHEMGRVFRIG